MIEYKGFMIDEAKGIGGVKIYRALTNSNRAIASNQSLTEIVALIDRELEKVGK